MLLNPFSNTRTVIKAIIFDCDGILVDTEELKFQAWKKKLETRGIILAPERYQSLIGHTGLSILNQIEEEHRVSLDPKIVDEKNELYWALQKNGVKSIAPMITVVNWARTKEDKKELLLGVATSASRNEVLFNLNYLQINDVFDLVLSGKEDLTKYQNPLGVNKPHPYIYLEMSLQLGLQSHECLVFEDSEAGVCAAKKAGCFVIAIPTKWTVQQNFSEADLIIYPSSSEKIIENIERLFKPLNKL